MANHAAAFREDFLKNIKTRKTIDLLITLATMPTAFSRLIDYFFNYSSPLLNVLKTAHFRSMSIAVSKKNNFIFFYFLFYYEA